MLMRNSHHLLWLVLAVCSVAGCDPGTTDPPPLPDVRPYVTGAAAAALTPAGTFVFPDPAPPGERPIMQPERARLLAASYVLSFGPSLERYWEEDRGRGIEVSVLAPEPRVYFASTPYGPFPDGYHPAFAHAYGPYYMVPMAEANTPTVLVAVAAYATQVEIGADGKINRPVQRGNEFLSRGIPVDPARAFPTPEQAVERVGRLTRARIESVPELVRVGLPQGPFESLWKLTLERPVRVRTPAGIRQVDVRHVYSGAGPHARLMIPAAAQPFHSATPAIRVSPTGEDLGVETVQVPILPGHPIVFEEAVVQHAPQN